MDPKDKDFEISRILPFEYAVNLFQNNELFFSKPSSWDDPYEKLNDYSNEKHTRVILAQCWCKTGYSDAMWRIFSQRKCLKNYGPGIQIRTHVSELKNIINDVKDEYNFKLYSSSVNYISLRKYREIIKTESRIKMAFIKRYAFRHELEYRFLINSSISNKNFKWYENGVNIKLNRKLSDIIHKVFIDPFASPHL
ncbi:hypothetical protein, partial [uncultured Desulfovibrio sp.]